MRISYWSSDVCSSVLAARRARVDDAILIISREMLVADQTIGPAVGDADLEHIGARAHRTGDIDTVRRLPVTAPITTVDSRRGDHIHPTETEIDPPVHAAGDRRGGEASAPRLGGAYVSHTKINVPVKRRQ